MKMQLGSLENINFQALEPFGFDVLYDITGKGCNGLEMYGLHSFNKEAHVF